MTALAISCIAVAGTGLILAIISIPFFTHLGRIKKKCTAKTMGTVVDYKCKRMGNNNTAITPVVEFIVDGHYYTAYRHYKGIVSIKKTSGYGGNSSDAAFYISDRDWYHRTQYGGYADYSMLAREKWPMNSEMPVIYNPAKPKQAYAEKIVTISNIVGIALMSAGGGLIAISGIVFLLLK